MQVNNSFTPTSGLLDPNVLFGFGLQPTAPASPTFEAQSLNPVESYLPTIGKLADPTQLFQSLYPSTIPDKLQKAAQLAYQKYKKQAGKCEATTNYLHRILLGDSKLSVRDLPKAQGLKENGKPLTYLKTLIQNEQLKPGMVIFINTAPKMKMSNLSASNRHWFTYMGLDPKTQQPVFCDQYGANRSLEKILSLHWAKTADPTGSRERKIHTIFDPYANDRSVLG